MTSVKLNSFTVEKSYNKTDFDFNFGRNKNLSTVKSDIHLSLAASVNITFWVDLYPHVYLIEVNNCIIPCSYNTIYTDSVRRSHFTDLKETF